MPRNSASSAKAERDQLRDRMRSWGCSVAQIAAEMSRRFNLRPRVAWRHALGWPQWKLAVKYNDAHPGVKLSDSRISAFESWPFGGEPPTVHYLANLAATFGHGCTAAQLVDADDLERLTPAARRLLTSQPASDQLVVPASTSAFAALRRDGLLPGVGRPERHPDNALSRDRRRILRCDARGLPIREEVSMAAEESAHFRRWSATTNVDDDVLEQMDADVAEIAARYLVDPPARVFASLLGARDDVFALIGGRQKPQHTMQLYKVAGQMCALLGHASADLGQAHAANTHARTALHCAERAGGYTPLRVYVAWVQSNVAYWEGDYDNAAELVESALPDAISTGTGLLRLASQHARINAARRRPSEVSRALAVAATAPAEPKGDEPGVFAFATGKAAYYASEAHRELGGDDHLDAAVDWAVSAVEEFIGQARPNAQFVAAARIDLARAHLARGDIDAVDEHLAPVLSATGTEHRTVPVISRVRSLNELLARRPDAASATITSLRDDLDEFCTHPAAAPVGLEPGATE